jgi:Flp pilus assembly protein TadG
MASFSMRAGLIALFCKDAEGSALIEASILTPLLITLMFGVFEFSWYFQKQQLVEAGVRDAARYMARVFDVQEGANPCSSGTDVTNAQNIAVTGMTSGGTARVSGWSAGNVNVTCAPINNSNATYAGPQTLYIINVSTSFADPALGYLGMLNLSVPSLSASHTERQIGPG